MKKFVFLLAALLLPASAHAGRRPYVIGYDTPMIADGDVELETWLDLVRAPKPDEGEPRGESEWRYWLGPRWAPFDGVEIAALAIWAQDLTREDGSAITEFWGELLEARVRLFKHETLGTAVAQLNFRIPITNDLPYQLSPSLNWMARYGRLRLTAQGGYAQGWGVSDLLTTDEAGNRVRIDGEDADYKWIVWNGGAAVDVVRGEVSPFVQLGVEGFGEHVLEGVNDLTDGKSTVNVGPTISFAKGRLWFTGGALAGLTADSPEVFVRGVSGLAF